MNHLTIMVNQFTLTDKFRIKTILLIYQLCTKQDLKSYSYHTKTAALWDWGIKNYNIKFICNYSHHEEDSLSPLLFIQSTRF